MAYRKSLIKKKILGFKREITKQDFLKVVKKFTEVFEKACGPSEKKLEIYPRIPYFTSFMISEEERLQKAEFNGKLILGEEYLLEQIPENLWPYVQVILNPRDESNAPRRAFAVVSFGALLPSHIIFYAQPDEVIMEKELFPQGKPPKGFKFGDGLEKNYKYYVPRSVIRTSVMSNMLYEINLKNRVPTELTTPILKL